MLHTLHLSNFALIDRHEITLNGGFNVITGETGAGKSLILDALSLCVGGRGGADMVRFGEKFAEIYATFDTLPPIIAKWFDEHSRHFEGEVIIRRQISEQGRSKAWINGQPASLNELKSLGQLLVNIHSQHAGLDLLKPNFALHWLDTVSSLSQLAHDTKKAYQRWQDLLNEQQNIHQNLTARLDRMNLLNAKIEDLTPLIGVDIQKVEQKHEELSNIEALIADAYQAANLLNNDSDEPSALDVLGRAIKLCEHYSGVSSSFESAYNSLLEAYHLIQEAGNNLADYAETQTPDPAELARLDGIIANAYRLGNKYRLPIGELIKEVALWQEELDNLQSLPDAKSLSVEINKAYDVYLALADELHAKRSKTAPLLCKTLQEQLAPLSLPNATCQFVFNECKPQAYGCFEVDLLFSANVGMPLLPLHKVASGGELSRMALIMQVMCASVQDNLPLLVFDEVDVGISGGTAQVVGELLKKLGDNQQLIAITHQAQVAACGHWHILVKKEHGNKTTSTLEVIGGDARIYELARMSGGVDITDETLAHAKSLLRLVGNNPKS